MARVHRLGEDRNRADSLILWKQNDGTSAAGLQEQFRCVCVSPIIDNIVMGFKGAA
jgi:hypothetical protein